MMKEAGVVLNKDHEPIYWHDPAGRTGGSLPDDLNLWNFIWEHRFDILGVAHSHPGSGVPGPSYTDVTTFSAIERGIGRRLWWPIITSNGIAVYRHQGPDKLSYARVTLNEGLYEHPWVEQLRKLSNYTT